MGNQIQLFHDASLFYLGREQELETRVQKLLAERQQFLAQNRALAQENAALREERSGLKTALGEARGEKAALQVALGRWKGLVDKDMGDWSTAEVREFIDLLWRVWSRKRREELDRAMRERLARLRG